jgi:hypothetical protein
VARYRLRAEKAAEDGSRVYLLQDVHDGAWLVGHDRFPVGSFQSAEAARAWGDEHYKGGTWAATRRGSYDPDRGGIK